MSSNLITHIILTFLVFNSRGSDVIDERNLTNKVVVVTGAAQGIGYAIADNFLANGAKVIIILDINTRKGKETEKELNKKYGENKADYIECDVTKDLKRVSKIIIKKYKYVDVLVNDAGILNAKPRKLILTDAIALIEFSLKFSKFMSKDYRGHGGTIMNIASIIVKYIDPTFTVYRAAKLAVLGFSRSLGHEYNYKKTGVRVLTICPGYTNTTLSSNIDYEITGTSEELIEITSKKNNDTIQQSPDSVARGIVKVFETAESGTSWDIKSGEDPVESPNTVTVTKIDDEDY